MAKETIKKTSIAGQALIEGLLMRGPHKTAIVCRKPGQEMVVKEEPNGTLSHGKWARIPVVRGVVSFWDSMKFGMSALMYSADFFDDGEPAEKGKFEAWLDRRLGEEKVEKLAMGLALAMGIGMPIVLFILLPTLLAGLVGDGMPSLLRNLMEGCIRILIFLCFIWITSRQSDVHRTYMYHGAEHKTIACYEAGDELTVENVRKYTRFHPRCGTSFLILVVIVSVFLYSVLPWSSTSLRVLFKLLLLPVVMGISYELLKWCGRSDNIATRIIRQPGIWVQHLTVFEPDDSMIEVAIAAVTPVLPEDPEDGRW